MTPFLAALRYAAKGWAVFPLGEKSKHPMIRTEDGGRGFHDATTDSAIVSDWFRRWLDANVGIATGAASGIDVLDVDPKNGGDVTLAALVAEHGALPPTLTADTGGGGLHLVFRHVPGIVRTIGFRPGLDYLGDHGYMVAAPSIHPSGGVYRWRSDVVTVADAPAWLLDLVTARKRKQAPSTGFRSPPLPSTFGGTSYGRVALERACAALAATGQGGRNRTLNAAAFNLGRLVAAGHLAAGDVVAHLLDAACANGYADEAGEVSTVAVIESGMAAGQAEGPRGPTLPWARRGTG